MPGLTRSPTGPQAAATAWKLSPPRAARPVTRLWQNLSTTTYPERVYDPAEWADQPEPVRRWLDHAIAAGTPLWSVGQLRMTGTIRLGRWRPFTATQVLAPARGYIWSARARVAGLPVSGYDRFGDGVGEMRWRGCGVVPVLSSAGPDVALSAAGRLAAEIVLVPTAFVMGQWTADDRDRDVLVGHLPGPATRRAVRLRLDPSGRVTQVWVRRWGAPAGHPLGWYPFVVTASAETTVGGVTIPSVLRAAWRPDGSPAGDGEFYRATVTHAAFH